MKYINKVWVVLIFLSSMASAQSSFQVGVGQQSIEPDKSRISLTISGYAAPGEGRFSLQWTRMEALPELTDISGVADKLYILSKGELLWRNILQSNNSWKNAGKAENIIAIACSNGKIYAASNNGELFETNIAGKIKWKKVSSIDRSVTSLTASGNKIFAANDRGGIWSASLSKGVSAWSSLTSLNGVISLAAIDTRLYALTGDGIMYKCEPAVKEARWIKTAYKNNITIKEDIRHITVADNGIYGVDKDNVLYAGNHRTDGNLSARAMAIRDNNKTVVIMGIDLVGLPDSFLGLVKQEIYNKHKLPPSAVLINISHTHFAPVVQNWDTWLEQNQRPDSVYLYSTVRNGILTAVDKALANMSPAQLFFGRGKTDIGYNRSLKEHPELYDSSVDVLKVKYTGSNAENYLFMASCHAVFGTAGKLHYTLSANFPGVARQLLEERTRTSNSIFLQGTAGDINPRDNGEYITGEKLSNEVISVLNKPMTEITGDISFFLDTINVQVKPWTQEELLSFRARNSGKPNDLGAEKNVKWSDVMLKHYKDGDMPSSLPVYVHTLNIGNWKLVGFSRETTTAYSFGVKNLWPDKLVSVTGYTDDVSSYLPTSMHVQAQNYEGMDSFFWYGVTPFPDSVDETIMQQIKALQR